MALTAAEKLVAAEEALHRLLLGEQAVEVDQGDGKRVKFAAFDKGEESLRRYIAELKAEIAGARKRGAIRLRFRA